MSAPQTRPGAVIAEDEPLLAQALQVELARAWPQLQVLAVVGDGVAAVRQALELRPQVLFFDIRMPGMGGIDAAAELAEQWDGPTEFPLLVFVTAYDQYAIQAFEAQALDYVLKPVRADRLQQTVDRVQQQLELRAAAQGSDRDARTRAASLDQAVERLRQLLHAPAGVTPSTALSVIQVSVGTAIRMVPVEQIACFEAADKYVRVLTAGHEYLIRTPLRELMPQLDPAQFWQIHRGAVVRVGAIEAVHRDEAGKLWLQLHGRAERMAVSRLYAHLFKAM